MNRSLVSSVLRVFTLILVLQLLTNAGFSGTVPTKRRHKKAPIAKAAVQRAPVLTAKLVVPKAVVRPASFQKAKPVASLRTVPRAAAGGPVIAGGPWTSPTYADSTDGDNVDGEDLEIRRAAVEALGGYNGSVVVVDPGTGRILSMVNQRVALGSGFQPCSTVKVSVALAGLSEKMIQ